MDERPQSIETISTHDKVRILDKALSDGKFFHGSAEQNLTLLDPNRAYNHSYKHGEHRLAVYAQPTDYVLPLILALMYGTNEEGKMGLKIKNKNDYFVITADQPVAWRDNGSIYILSPDSFKANEKFGEVISFDSVTVEQEIKVTPEIISYLIENGLIECNIPPFGDKATY